jgi:hypothetical protein
VPPGPVDVDVDDEEEDESSRAEEALESAPEPKYRISNGCCDRVEPTGRVSAVGGRLRILVGSGEEEEEEEEEAGRGTGGDVGGDVEPWGV